uniref:Heme chaperone HemW n=1 Tax=Dictyoglomus thermophilum TaxID=14 RepID=A0A7C3RJ59_DICTH
MKTIGVYIHYPFCVKKCPYCDFTSFVYSIKEEERYLEYISKEIQLKAEGEIVDTIYFGGGTPSLMSLKVLNSIFESINKNYRIRKDAEITIEVNPGTIDKKKLSFWKNIGINRISIGAQSFIDEELFILGRIHTVSDTLKTFFLLREYGFDNINFDLIYSIPFQNPNNFYKSLDFTLSLNPEHISIYNLIIEEGTLFYEGYIKGEFTLPDNDEEANMYAYAMNLLEEVGFIHYEISNFARNINLKCRHNLKYWNQDEYHGYGVSAYSFTNHIRYGNYKNLFVYYEKINNGELPIENIEILNDETYPKDYLFVKLRLMEGISEKEFFEKFGKKISDYIPNLSLFLKKGLIKRKNDRICLTKKGVLLANEIFKDIL